MTEWFYGLSPLECPGLRPPTGADALRPQGLHPRRVGRPGTGRGGSVEKEGKSMKPEKQTFLKPCLALLLLLAASFGVWRIWDVRHKPIDTADDRQMAASILPLQNPTLISGEHGYRRCLQYFQA